MTSLSGYFIRSFAWGTVAKVFDAATRFFTIPLLIVYYGKQEFGVLTLAMAANAYMQLLDLGINVGSTKYFSQWISDGSADDLNAAARASVGFYMVIGAINAVALGVVALNVDLFFKLNVSNSILLQKLLLMLAASSLIQWVCTVGNQLLVADHQIALVQRIGLLRSVASQLLVFVALGMKLSLEIYFLVNVIIGVAGTVPFLFIAKSRGLMKTFLPSWNWKPFMPILRYGGGIFAMGIFQFTANQSRPLVLGAFGKNSALDLADYRIMEVFPIFIISVGGMVLNILLPTSSRAVHNGDIEQMNRIAYDGTRLSSVLLCCLCIPLAISAESVLQLYVKGGYSHLGIWLSIWCMTIIMALQNNPVSSLILATGKTKVLVYVSAVACILSLIVNAYFAGTVGAGSAVLGYAIYIILQTIAEFLILVPHVLKMDSRKVFVAFAAPFLEAVVIGAVIRFCMIHSGLHGLVNVVISTGSFLLIFGCISLLRNRNILLNVGPVSSMLQKSGLTAILARWGSRA